MPGTSRKQTAPPDRGGAAALAEPALERRTLRKVSMRLVPFLALLYLLAYIDRVNVGFAALQMNAQLGIAATAYGAVAGIFYIGYVLFDVPSNLVLAKVGARRWIARIMITWGLISAACAFCRGPTSLAVLRFLLGAAEAGFVPGVLFYLSGWFPARHRGKIIGGFMVAGPVTGVIGSPISAAILGIKALGLAGWQWLFLLEGIPAALVGCLVLVYLTEKPADARWLEPEERAWLTETMRAEGGEQERLHGAGVGKVLLDPRIWLFGVMYMGFVGNTSLFGLWAPQIIKEIGGLTNFQVGLIAAVPSLAAVAAMLLWSRHSDAAGERRWHVVGALFLGALSFLAAGAVEDPRLRIAILTVTAACLYGAQALFWTLPMARLSGTGAAAGIALINSVGCTAGYLGPQLQGYLKDQLGGFGPGLWALGVMAAVAGVIGLLLTREGGGAAAPRLAEPKPG